MPQRYDIVLYGATGFTGVYVLEAIAKSAHSDIRLAVAGRSEQKLKKVLKEVSDSTGVYHFKVRYKLLSIFQAMISQTLPLLSRILEMKNLLQIWPNKLKSLSMLLDPQAPSPT